MVIVSARIASGLGAFTVPACHPNEYRLPVAFRRESPIRGRRLRFDEALFERFAMSRAGYWFILRVAPHIDKTVIPRTKGRLSSAGIDTAGLVTATGCQARTAAHAAAGTDRRLRRAPGHRVQLRAPQSPGVECQPAGASRMHGRV